MYARYLWNVKSATETLYRPVQYVSLYCLFHNVFHIETFIRTLKTPCLKVSVGLCFQASREIAIYHFLQFHANFDATIVKA